MPFKIAGDREKNKTKILWRERERNDKASKANLGLVFGLCVDFSYFSDFYDLCLLPFPWSCCVGC
jgi:hypothetical protein